MIFDINESKQHLTVRYEMSEAQKLRYDMLFFLGGVLVDPSLR